MTPILYLFGQYGDYLTDQLLNILKEVPYKFVDLTLEDSDRWSQIAQIDSSPVLYYANDKEYISLNTQAFLHFGRLSNTNSREEIVDYKTYLVYANKLIDRYLKELE
jgi:hypothetical protein